MMRLASLVLAAALTTPIALAVETPPPPTEGIWWSSEAPGTGVAFNVDTEGRWFAAIFLYDTEGEPTFLTMQGTSIDYFESPNLGVGELTQPYARAVSPLIRSEGGQCLRCPWTRATAAVSGDGEASLSFYGRNRAEFAVGDWRLRLAPLVDAVDERPEFPQLWAHERFDASDYYVATIDTEDLKTVVTARLVPDQAPGFPIPWRNYILECIDCRTTGSEEPSTPAQEELIAGPYYLKSFRFRCDPSDARTGCVAERRITDARFQLSAFYMDQTGREITLIDHGDGEARAPGRIDLKAMRPGWQPALP